ncbi:hypothetical protein ACP275_03G005100 [Erythranthe tilingii]
MASSILRRGSIFRNLICGGRPTLRRRISSFADSPMLLIGYTLQDNGKAKLDTLYEFYRLADKKVIRRKQPDGKLRNGILVGVSNGWLALYRWRIDLFDVHYTCRGDKLLDMFVYDPLLCELIQLPRVENLPIPIDKLKKPTKIIVVSRKKTNFEYGCRAIMCFGPENRLYYCNPGIFDQHHQRWTPIDKSMSIHYDDFVYSSRRKQLFCATKCGRVESWDFRDVRCPILEWETTTTTMKKINEEWFSQYLVFAGESNRLFLVRRNVDSNNKTVGFDVDQVIFDEKKKEKVEVKYTLDGMAFFVGSVGDSFVIEDKDKIVRYNIEPDSIYFTDPKKTTLRCDDDVTHAGGGGHDIGIFNYETKKVSPLYYSSRLQSVDHAPVWSFEQPHN